jgi:hypothetical protein
MLSSTSGVIFSSRIRISVLVGGSGGGFGLGLASPLHACRRDLFLSNLQNVNANVNLAQGCK